MLTLDRVHFDGSASRSSLPMSATRPSGRRYPWRCPEPAAGGRHPPAVRGPLGAPLLNATLRFINDNIACTHERANMFATAFVAVLEPRAARLSYIDIGHDPPVILRHGEVCARLCPTGPAADLLPGLPFQRESPAAGASRNARSAPATIESVRRVIADCQRSTLPGCFLRHQGNTGDRGERA